jgi:hypothetical protein
MGSHRCTQEQGNENGQALAAASTRRLEEMEWEELGNVPT